MSEENLFSERNCIKDEEESVKGFGSSLVVCSATSQKKHPNIRIEKGIKFAKILDFIF